MVRNNELKRLKTFVILLCIARPVDFCDKYFQKHVSLFIKTKDKNDWPHVILYCWIKIN